MDVTNLMEAAAPAAAAVSCVPDAADSSSAALAALFADLVEQLAAFDAAPAAGAARSRDARAASDDGVESADAGDEEAESASFVATVPVQLAPVWNLPGESVDQAAIVSQSTPAQGACEDVTSASTENDAGLTAAKPASTAAPPANVQAAGDEGIDESVESAARPVDPGQPRAEQAVAEDREPADAPKPIRTAAARALARALSPGGQQPQPAESMGTRSGAAASPGEPAASPVDAPAPNSSAAPHAVSAARVAVSPEDANAAHDAAAQAVTTPGGSDSSQEASAGNGNGGDAGRGRKGETPREPIASSRVSTASVASVGVTAPQVRLAPVDSAPASVAPSTPAAGGAAAEPVEQIVRAMQVQMRDGVSEAVVRLRPEHLGDVRIALTVERGAVTAVLHADRADVRAQIVAHADTLKDALSEQGLRLDELVVREDGRRQPQERPTGEQQAPPRRFRRVPARAFDLPGDD